MGNVNKPANVQKISLKKIRHIPTDMSDLSCVYLMFILCLIIHLTVFTQTLISPSPRLPQV